MINNDWKDILEEEIHKEYFIKMMHKINEEYSNEIIYPPYNDIFNALNLTSYNDTKVVILGQDPYHEEGQAHGLAFSVRNQIAPPSLKNIFKELNNDLNINNTDTDLTSWAKQGVLLLNTTLTVKAHKANSHSKYGWQIFTDKIISELNKKDEPIVFILWGNNAIKKEELITNNKHLIIKSVHPSPLSASRGFFNSKPFSKTNDFLIKNNLKPIDWHTY